MSCEKQYLKILSIFHPRFGKNCGAPKESTAPAALTLAMPLSARLNSSHTVAKFVPLFSHRNIFYYNILIKLILYFNACMSIYVTCILVYYLVCSRRNMLNGYRLHQGRHLKKVGAFVSPTCCQKVGGTFFPLISCQNS